MVVVVLVAEEGIYIMLSKGTLPCQLLLESIVHVAVYGSGGASVTAGSVTYQRIVVGLSLTVAQTHVSLDGECEVLEELDVGVELSV